MKETVVVAIAFSLWLVAAPCVMAQPILERLERRIRDRLTQPNVPPPPQPAGPENESPAPPAVSGVQKAADEPGYLGVMADDREDRGRGVRILDVRLGSPAEKAGLRKDDLIVAIATVAVRQMSDMADVLPLYRPGDSVAFDILRDGKPRQVEVILGRRPAAARRPIAAPPPAERAPPEVAQLQRRIEELERRITELEQALAEALKKE